MSNPNKNKGKSWERELSKHLTEVFGYNFERVWSSGAFTGGKNVDRLKHLTPSQQLATVGDIIPPEQLCNYSWEAKFYKTIPFHTFFYEEGNALLDKWIEQAKCPDRHWFLVFKINNMGGFVVFAQNDVIPYILPNPNVMLYKDCRITKLEGFFEANKELMLRCNNLGFISCTPIDIEQLAKDIEKLQYKTTPCMPLSVNEERGPFCGCEGCSSSKEPDADDCRNQQLHVDPTKRPFLK